MLRACDQFAGGMQWPTTKENQYLTRYRTDPASGDKKSVSLEGRTAETLAIHTPSGSAEPSSGPRWPKALRLGGFGLGPEPRAWYILRCVVLDMGRDVGGST